MSAFLSSEDGTWELSQIKWALNAKGVVFGISDAAIRSCISGKEITLSSMGPFAQAERSVRLS